MTNAIQLYERMSNPLEAIAQCGEFFARSGMFGCDRKEQGQVLAMICLAEKRSPVEILRTYDIMDGKLRKKALAALAEFRSRGGKHRWIKSGDEEGNNQEAVLELTPPDGPPITYSYSMEDAKKEGLIRDKSRWTKRPGNMLRARCISNGIGMVMPEIYAGDDGDSEPSEPAALVLPAVVEAKPEPAKVVYELKPAEPPKADDAKPAPEPAKPQPEIEVKEKQAAPAPVPEPTKEKTFAKGPETRPAQDTLPDDLVRKVEAAIGAHAQAAIKWLLKEKWLEKGQGLERLTEARAKRIVAQKDSFIRAINA